MYTLRLVSDVVDHSYVPHSGMSLTKRGLINVVIRYALALFHGRTIMILNYALPGQKWIYYLEAILPELSEKIR